MKLERHSAILRFVREQRIVNQDALRQALGAAGVEVAQATLSRDIRELGLQKQADPHGGSFYVVPVDGPVRPELAGILRTWLLSFEGVGPLLVLRTAPGGAAAVAAALDQAGWVELVGTVGTAETVLMVTRSEQARKAVERRIEGLRQHSILG
ncbi:MAG: arginine repressor [Gemmatimonadota bacterium]